MCRWLDVSRSGFYEWRGRPASATAQRRFWLAGQVRKAFRASRGTYGYRRGRGPRPPPGRGARPPLGPPRGGVDVGPELVRHLMTRLGLVACQPRPWRTTTIAGTEAAPSDHVAGDFTADAPR